MTFHQRLRQLAGRPLVRNYLSLFGVQVATNLLPLITIPYVVRVLTPTTWGLLAMIQAFQTYIVLLVEYGFLFSATRQIAEHRQDQEVLADVVAGVIGAKALLAVLVIVPALIVMRVIPTFRDHPLLFWLGFAWAIMQAFHPLWFFQGMERMGLVSALDVAAKGVTTAGIFLLIHSPSDAWKVFGLQVLGASISTVLGLGFMAGMVRLRFPRPAPTRQALRMGFTIFISRGAVSLYAVSNAFILGLFQPTAVVGIYAGAEKIIKPILGLANPLSQTLYPHITYLLKHSREKAARVAYKGMFIFAAGGLLVGTVVFVGAPLLVKILLGQRFMDSTPVLQVLALSIPLIAMSNILGILWMLPLHMDKAFNAIVVAAGVVNVVVAAVVAPRYGAGGMAWTVVLAEAIVTLGLYRVLRWHRLDPVCLVKAAEAIAPREADQSVA